MTGKTRAGVCIDSELGPRMGLCEHRRWENSRRRIHRTWRRRLATSGLMHFRNPRERTVAPGPPSAFVAGPSEAGHDSGWGPGRFVFFGEESESPPSAGVGEVLRAFTLCDIAIWPGTRPPILTPFEDVPTFEIQTFNECATSSPKIMGPASATKPPFLGSCRWLPATPHKPRREPAASPKSAGRVTVVVCAGSGAGICPVRKVTGRTRRALGFGSTLVEFWANSSTSICIHDQNHSKAAPPLPSPSC